MVFFSYWKTVGISLPETKAHKAHNSITVLCHTFCINYDTLLKCSDYYNNTVLPADIDLRDIMQRLSPTAYSPNTYAFPRLLPSST